ncbi:hypothetical protein GCM10011400_58450 [Paraburkholderia caffeinilytica]|uniref:Uncharacterized protein n=1 Tax=Paraburkholderia caffeinilytica TaxID=1761016 RepID=A0ABQ1NCQ5_9BURK|nr:hypothetical protein GCM10011400_58450 [Paraburkholderia caffeinilytica]
MQFPDEPSEALRARLRRVAQATRDDARQAATVPFPAHVSVLAGPLRRRPARSPGAGSQPAGCVGPAPDADDDGGQ